MDNNQSKILHKFFTSLPSAQNALDIFEGEWSSILPGELAHLRAGNTPLFEDPKGKWAITEFGSVKGMNALDLGPLEGGHAYMLEKEEVSSILSIEANSRAYLKCLITKEILDLKKSHFLCGNFVEYLKVNTKKYDLCFASGVLYHQTNPVEFIRLLSQSTDRLYLWTHYYDPQLIKNNKNVAHKFTDQIVSDYKGFKHTLYRFEYDSALNWKGFSGGVNTHSYWMSKEDILSALKEFGYDTVKMNFHQPEHPNGPSFALVCIKT